MFLFVFIFLLSSCNDKANYSAIYDSTVTKTEEQLLFTEYDKKIDKSMIKYYEERDSKKTVHEDIIGESAEGGTIDREYKEDVCVAYNASFFGETGKIEHYFHNFNDFKYLKIFTYTYNSPIYFDDEKIVEMEKEGQKNVEAFDINKSIIVITEFIKIDNGLYKLNRDSEEMVLVYNEQEIELFEKCELRTAQKSEQGEEKVNNDNKELSISFSTLEAAYYEKYVELAGTFGTHSLYDNFSDSYTSHSYLDGVCVVNLLDFNSDGIQDLFVIYSNGEMDKKFEEGYNLEIYNFPSRLTYEIEIWTYKDGALSQILNESTVSLCFNYPNNAHDFFKNYYRLFVTVYENSNGLPIVQLYNENGEQRYYTNIYYSEEKIIRDELIYDGYELTKNGLVVSEELWSNDIAGYNKILLCALLADSSNSSKILADGYGIDYGNTLKQTEEVVRYLSDEDKTPKRNKFNIVEGSYISLYLQEIDRANRMRITPEFIENHYYALYDIDSNEIPELILYEGSSGASTHYHFYTVMNNEIKLCGEYGRTSLLSNGEGGLIAYFGRMGGYDIKKISLKDDVVLYEDIADGYAKEEYPELEDFGYENYDLLAFCPPRIPFAFYLYNNN